MAIRVMHILDEQAPADAVLQCAQLLRLLPVGRVAQSLLVIGRAPAALRPPERVTVRRIGRRFDWPLSWVFDLRKALAVLEPQVVLSWSTGAAVAARFARRERIGIVHTVVDPAEATAVARWYRSLGAGPAGDVLCASAIVQRRLVEAGLPRGSMATVRPGVDFGEIRAARGQYGRGDGRSAGPGRRQALVFATAAPPSRAGGQFYAIWAMAILHQIWPEAKLLIPGLSREQARLQRLVDRLHCPQVYEFPGEDVTPADLLARSDALLMPALGDVPTSWIAWAMASGVPVIGSAVPSVAEFIADRHNGFLCRPREPHTLAIRIRTAVESGDLLRQCVDTARGQAYDVFRAQRCVEEYLRVIEAVAGGGRAVDVARDAAVVA